TARIRDHQNGSSYGTVYGDSVTVTGPQVRPSNGIIRLTVACTQNSQTTMPIAPISNLFHLCSCPVNVTCVL
ncbi:hypothetical protein ARMGADRAFT_1014367, partial [Armillaria gallica]